MRWTTVRWLTAAVVVALLTASLGGIATAAKPGNSTGAKACQKGGWMTLYDANHNAFASQEACVSYSAQGGQYGTPPPAHTGIGVFTGELASGDGVTQLAAFGGSCSPSGSGSYYETYSVTLVAPATLTITHEGSLNGNGTLVDPYLMVHSGAFDSTAPCTGLVASNDDHPAPPNWDSRVVLPSLSAGSYTVVATTVDSTTAGFCCGTYKLTIAAS